MENVHCRSGFLVDARSDFQFFTPMNWHDEYSSFIVQAVHLLEKSNRMGRIGWSNDGIDHKGRGRDSVFVRIWVPA